jgi:chemotaxis protein MotB
VKKKHHEGEHESSERWLLTYADLITLLLGLFVILYAMSKVDAGKYAEIVAALGGVFGQGKTGMLQGNNGVMMQGVPRIPTERERIAEELRSALKDAVKENLVSIVENERGLTVHLMEELLFESGRAELKESSLSTLDSLASVLKTLSNDLRVEGHTDNIPIHNSQFPSNWHLSVARALNTAFRLIDRYGLPPERVSVVGFSEYQPLVPNSTDSNRSRNRRVDIVVVINNSTAADTIPQVKIEEKLPEGAKEDTSK